MKTYYHIKPTANIEKVLKNGIHAKEGKIFVVIKNEKMILDQIALNQMFLSGSYAVFAIRSSGINGRITNDDVAEYTAPFHRVIHQDMIEPGFIKLMSINQLLSIEERVRLTAMEFGIPEKQIQEMIKDELQLVEFMRKKKTTVYSIKN